LGWIANFEWIDKLGWMADYRARNELTFWLKFWYLQSAFTELEHNTQNKKKRGEGGISKYLCQHASSQTEISRNLSDLSWLKKRKNVFCWDFNFENLT